MPRRALLSLLLLVALTACTSPLRLEPQAQEPGTVDFCRALRDAAPASVAGQPLREVDPARAGLAWGDPAIVLRCGVPEPGALRPDSPLADVDGIGWLDEPAEDGLRFTAVDLPAYVRVDVPAAYQPEADALTDLSQALRRAATRAGRRRGRELSAGRGDARGRARAAGRRARRSPGRSLATAGGTSSTA